MSAPMPVAPVEEKNELAVVQNTPAAGQNAPVKKRGKSIKKISTPTLQKNNRSGMPVTEKNSAWLNEPSVQLDKDELYSIVIFFVFHSPCADSARSKPLHDNWSEKEPWHKDGILHSELLNHSSNPNLHLQTTLKDMETTLINENMPDNFSNIINFEKVVFACAREYESKPFFSIFKHIRNSFAHGRLNMKEIYGTKIEDDYAFIMEDVFQSDISARMILKKSTLLEWIKIIEAGPPPKQDET